jgi:hypothetical protein
MADYFVRISGADANAGTSAATAWRTIGKALGATGIASGDRVFIGAGLYREVVTVAMTSATADTQIIGDVDGAMTGDAGEVIWTNYLNGWNDTPSISDVCNLAGRDFLTFKNLYIAAGGASNCIDGNTATSTDIVIDTCVLVAYGTSPALVTAPFATALNWTIKNSQIASFSGFPGLVVTLTTGVGSDYDANVQVMDSTFLMAGNPTAVQVTNSGTAAQKGGGVDIARCSFIGFSAMTTVASQISTTIPCTVVDCLLLCQQHANAGTTGQILDLGGNVGTATWSNVTVHATSKTATEDFPAPLTSFAHEWMWGMTPRRFHAPMIAGALSRGTITTATTDIEGRTRPEGSGRLMDSGTATSASATTLTDSSKTWYTGQHIGALVRITGGTGVGQVKHISNTSTTTLTIGGLSGDWAVTPDNTSTYVVYSGPPTQVNKATSGSTTTFVVSSAAWSVNKWAGYSLEITAGSQAGTTRTIVSNTATTITTAAFPGAIDNTSVGSIYWPGTSLTANQNTPGAFELHDDARKETTITDAGGVGIVINGPGSHDILIPVDAVSTTITVRARYGVNHGSTNKPQALILANGEIGVSAQTVTMTVAADTWETLTFSAFTPTALGVVIVRLVSRSDTPYGRAFFDTVTVT